MADFPHKPWAQPEHRNKQYKPDEKVEEKTPEPAHESVLLHAVHVLKDFVGE